MRLSINDLAQEFATKKGATVDYCPDFTRQEITTQKRIVVPYGVESSRIARVGIQTDLILHLVFLQRITSKDEIPGLVARIQNVATNIHNFKSASGARVVNIEFEPLYAQDLIRERNQFTSVIKITFRIIEP